MHIDLSYPAVVIDVELPAQGPAEAAERCDMCGAHAELFRMVRTEDALCESCFVAWHG